ncbi:MAG TPA: hypothetical protein VIL65_01095 [Beijerinckiaceae bacterium]
MRPARLAAVGLLLAGAAPAAEDPLAARPAFSKPEQPARAPARCEELRGQAAGVPDGEDRIDLALTGALTLVRTDGALWYLIACTAPDIRVMCVTYDSNGMKAGDRVLLRGAYNRVDADHVALDPCLATPIGASPQP